MIIAIPVQNDKQLKSNVEQHFGPANNYVTVDENGRYLKTIVNESSHKGGAKLPPDFLKDNNVDIVLCEELGPRAVTLCKQNNIQVFLGHAETAEEMYKLWNKNKLVEANTTNACADHKI